MRTGPLGGVTVLVIDDHLDTLELVELVLQRAGARVLAAPSAEAGLRFLDANPIDVVVCDLSMPDVDGFALLQSIRSRRDGKRDLPALAVTADAVLLEPLRGRASAFDGHALKPFSPDALVAEIVRLASSRAPRVAAG